VQLTREQEHLWEPKGAAQLMQIDGALDDYGPNARIAAYDFQTSYPSNGAPTLALLLTGSVAPDARAYEMGDRTAVPPYAVPNLRVVANDMPPSCARRGCVAFRRCRTRSRTSRMWTNSRARRRSTRSEFRLRHLDDVRAPNWWRATAAHAGWIAHTAPQQQGAQASG